MTEKLDIDHLRQWIGRSHGGHRHRHRAAREGPARHAVPGGRRARRPAMPRRSRRIGAWRSRCFRCRCSGPTATRPAAASCRRCRCRAGCGPAARSNSSSPCASAMRLTRTSRIADVHGEDRLDRHAVLRLGRAHRSRRRAASRSASGRTSSIARCGGAPARPPRPRPRRRQRSTARPMSADPVLLFRYSALTFNGHRIHYDRDYVTKVEGYPGPDLPRPAAGGVHRRARREAAWRQAAEQSSAIAACSRCSRAASSRSTPTTRRQHGAVDREFRRPADDEGDGDVVRPSLRDGAKRSMVPHVEAWIARRGACHRVAFARTRRSSQ